MFRIFEDTKLIKNPTQSGILKFNLIIFLSYLLKEVTPNFLASAFASGTQA